MTKTSDKKKSKGSVFRYLPNGYQPGPFDVLCGRGRKCYYHSGNEHFRAVVQSMIPSYSQANTKMEKGYILSVIVQQIRDRAGLGGFIKQDSKTSLWYEVGDFLAREKVSQAFRDALSDKYKSSNAYKKMRREVEQTGQLFETYLQNQEATPEQAMSVHNTTSETVLKQNLQPSSFVVNKASDLKSMTSFTDSLVGLLEQDISRHCQKQTVFSQELPSDLEPRPIAGFNPFERDLAHQGACLTTSNKNVNHSRPQMTRQGAGLSCPIFVECQAGTQLPSYESDCGFHSCPEIPVRTTQFSRGFDEMSWMSEARSAYQV